MAGRSRSSGAVAAQRWLVALMSFVVFTGVAVEPSAAQPAQDRGGRVEGQQVSDLRIGVLAVADTIAALGRHPELAAPLPFTRTSVADVLRLDDVVTKELISALAGEDLVAALEELPGIVDIEDNGPELSFAYEQTEEASLGLAYDNGDLRFGRNSGAGMLTVSLRTRSDGERFVLAVDPDEPDPLLRFALVSEPELELTVAVNTDALERFAARQGFTELDVTGGKYEIDRAVRITLRDPNGRGKLTLEDLRYSTVVDLFRMERTADTVDIGFDVALPDGITVTGGTEDARQGTLTLKRDGASDSDPVWPDPTTAADDYGEALAALTGLTHVAGITAFAEYTGAALALQNAADVDFPNLGGSIADVFAPGDELLDVLATAPVAEIRCGLTPDNPPAGAAAAGDTVYCDAVTAAGIDEPVKAEWSTSDGAIVTTDPDRQLAAVGADPSATVQIDGSEGQPDVTVELTLDDDTHLIARTLPRTVQDVTRRIDELATAADRTGGASATVDLIEDRLAVAVDVTATTASSPLTVGDPATLGVLVGLTGLETGAAAATATVAGASFDAGFGIPFADDRAVVLLPADDGTLIEVEGVSAAAPNLTGLTGRIGFLGVDVEVTELTLGAAKAATPVVALTATGDSAPIPLDDLITTEGLLVPGALLLDSQLEASIEFTATEQEISSGVFAVGGNAAETGRATVVWPPVGVPGVEFDTGYEGLRVFDPVPAVFLSGTAAVTSSTEKVKDLTTPGDDDDEVTVDADEVAVDVTGVNLYEELGVVAPSSGTVELARPLLGPGVGCRSITIEDQDTLTCEGLAPGGTAAFDDGETVDLIVLGDPFVLRDSIIEGFAGTLNRFEWLIGDNVGGPDDLPHDQYTSTLPLVDLRPDQMAPERADLADGIAKMILAATEDDSGLTGGQFPPVSSAQELAAAVETLVGNGATIGYELDGDLGVTLAASAASSASILAPLRFLAPGPEQTPEVPPPLVGQVEGAEVSVGLVSATTLDLDVDTTSAVVSTGAGTQTVSTATLNSVAISGGPFPAGVGEVTFADGSTAALDITVNTTFDKGLDLLQTARTGGFADGDAPDIGATATLNVDGQTVQYQWAASESSGGAGAPAPSPEPMQVEYLAEGLEGLAAALEVALDGAAPRTAGPGGTPVAAPLIGTNLDAGAGVAGALRQLLSTSRVELGEVIATAPDALKTQLATAFNEALDAADFSVTVDTEDVDVECKADPCDGAAGPADWNRVAVTVQLTEFSTLEPSDKDALPFAVGLDGLAVRSTEKIHTETDWTLPVTLELIRGVGPAVSLPATDGGAGLTLDVEAKLPTTYDSTIFGSAGPSCPDPSEYCLPAIVGYLPALLTADGEAGELKTTVRVKPTSNAEYYSLFDLRDGKVALTSGFTDRPGELETGLELGFETMASNFGSFDLLGTIVVPWKAADGFGEVEYTDVQLDVGEVIATLATPFATADPYLGPVRDVIDVLRTPIPVVSDLSELAGAGEISLLSLLDTLATISGESDDAPDDSGNPPGGGDGTSDDQNGKKEKTSKLELAYRIISFIESTVKVVDAIAPFANEQVPLEQLSAAGALLTVAPGELTFRESCTETVRSRTVTSEDRVTRKKNTAKCPDEETSTGLQKQTAEEKRRGERTTNTSVAQTTKSITGSIPGFSLPFLADPDQLVDVLTGEGEASYFRLDLGTLGAQVSYTQKFAPIPIGPVPVQPFVGGSISIEGRLALGFDSMPLTLAVQSLDDPGDVRELTRVLEYDFDGGDILREGFYIDDLDADGVDVPEVKLITTIEAGAGVSIGIVSAGLKGGITLTINLNINDPDGDGRLRVAEIRDDFAGKPQCIFDVLATLEAFLQFFFEIDLFLSTVSAAFDIVRLGPYDLFRYSCAFDDPDLVAWNGSGRLGLVLTDDPDEFEVRQFDDDPDGDGNADGAAEGGTTVFEVQARGVVQRVDIRPNDDNGFTLRIFRVAEAVATQVAEKHELDSLDTLSFKAPRGRGADQISFLRGETLDDNGDFVSTPFRVPVEAHGGKGNDVIVTGDGNDTIHGEEGNDTIDAGAGDDVVDGGDGNDALAGGPGRDDIDGGDGADKLHGGPGPDRVVGGEGDDFLLGGPGRDVRAVVTSDLTEPPVSGEDESIRSQVGAFDSGDILIGGPGGDVLDGADGSDIVIGGDAPLANESLDSLFGETTRTVDILYKDATNPAQVDVTVRTANVPSDAELDVLCESGEEEPGSANRDVLTGGPERDIVVGGDGPDELSGGAGPDEMCGRAGNDFIVGDAAGAGEATAGDDGEGGDADVIRGGHGDDRIDAGPGDDVVFGDDSRLYRDGIRVLDGSLGADADGDGDDYLAGGAGDDVVAGGDGSDLVLGGEGDDLVAGEGRDIVPEGGDAPDLADRIVDCRPATRIVHGGVDLNGDLLVSGLHDLAGATADDGQLAGLTVDGGRVRAPTGEGSFTGLIGGAVVVVDGWIDLDRDGHTDEADTGIAPVASMLAATGSNPAGDCLLGEAGEDVVLGGSGSDYAGGGPGIDLIDGGDGNDLLLGDAGTDVVLGGPHHDVLVGGEGDDHLAGGDGNDRLRGNENDDDLVGGGETSGSMDGGDVLLGGRGEDLLAGGHAEVASSSIIDAVALAAWHDENNISILPQSVVADPSRPDNSAVRCPTDPGVAERWITLFPADSSHDELFGGFGCDWVFGQEGDDLVRGGQGDDIVEAGPGADTAMGDAGDDIVVGGSSVNVADSGAIVVGRSGTGAPDGADLLLGDGGPDGILGADVLIGDNGTPSWAEGPGRDHTVVLADLPRADGGRFGDDLLIGDGGPGWMPTRADDGTLSWCADLGANVAIVADDDSDDLLFGQAGDDCVVGGSGEDYLEGGSGGDRLAGGSGDDGIIGGSSARNGKPMGNDGRRLRQLLDRDDDPTGLADSSAAGLPDGRDLIAGGEGDDVMLGDNGRITRPRPTTGDGAAAVRHVAMADTTAGDTSGSDRIYGGPGSDVLYGQLDDTAGAGSDALGTGDLLHGGGGGDVVVGDVAVVIPTPAERLGAADTLGLRGTRIAEPVYQLGTFVPVTYTPTAAVDIGGADVAWGGAGDDVLRLGFGPDRANGDSGDDVLFGGQGQDALWGGYGRDRLFGGHGDDLLDVKPRETDPSINFEVAGAVDTDRDPATSNGADLLYGGWGPDELQADVGRAGQHPESDHLIDWVGNHNVFYVCDGALGRGRVIRSPSPALRSLLIDLAVAAGATDVDSRESGGWFELGLVRRGDNSANSSPHPSAPGNFTCEGASGGSASRRSGGGLRVR